MHHETQAAPDCLDHLEVLNFQLHQYFQLLQLLQLIHLIQHLPAALEVQLVQVPQDFQFPHWVQ